MVRETTQHDRDIRGTLTIQETADFLGLSRGSVYAAARAGDLPVVRVGRRLLVSKDALAAWLNSRPAAN
jgi:excisionase family DNA binding protein